MTELRIGPSRYPGVLSIQVLLGLCGPLAACAIIVGDGLGASLTPGYSLRTDAISELVAVGAARKALVDPFLLALHALTVLFAAGLYLELRPSGRDRIAPALLGGAGVAGVILTLFFPCDPGCEAFVSLRGTLHIFIAVPMGVSVVIAILLFEKFFGRHSDWASFQRYSRITALGTLALAAATVIAAETDWVGLLERALTLGYIQWYFVIGATVAARRVRRERGLAP